MKTSLDYKKIFNNVQSFATKNRVYLIAGLIVAIFGFAIFRIQQLADPQIDQAKLDEAIAGYKRVQIDEKTVEEIRQLVESKVEVSPKFNDRNNPFAE
jgi:predicted negative regulator of RcsB-dependent stress response